MLLNLTDLSDESLQSQIRAKILGNELQAGASLTSIRVLAREQKVSVITVQRAYEHLLRENLIHSRRGKGFFVSELPQTEKKEMAIQKLLANIKRPIQAAITEGLTRRDIQNAIDLLLKSIDT